MCASRLAIADPRLKIVFMRMLGSQRRFRPFAVIHLIDQLCSAAFAFQTFMHSAAFLSEHQSTGKLSTDIAGHLCPCANRGWNFRQHFFGFSTKIFLFISIASNCDTQSATGKEERRWLVFRVAAVRMSKAARPKSSFRQYSSVISKAVVTPGCGGMNGRCGKTDGRPSGSVASSPCVTFARSPGRGVNRPAVKVAIKHFEEKRNPHNNLYRFPIAASLIFLN